MRAIKIDAKEKTITEIQIDGLDDLQKAVGGWITFALEFENQDTLYVDDEGLLKNPEDFQHWVEQGEHRVFAGNGIIQGTSVNGDGVDAKSTIEEIKEKLCFIDSLEAFCLAKQYGL